MINRLLLNRLLIGALLVGCSAGLHAADTVLPIRVMSFNLRYDGTGGKPSGDANAWVSFNENNHSRRDLALQLINDYGPDLLGVQESLHHQTLHLDHALTSYTRYGVGRMDGKAKGEYCAIYYRTDRFSLVDKGTFWLSDTPTVPSKMADAGSIRIASWVVLKDHENKDRSYLVLNTHWDNVSGKARILSARLIPQHLAAIAPDMPQIVMGDLNQREEGGPIVQLTGAGKPGEVQLLDSYREVFPTRSHSERTFHNFQGGERGSRIDYIFHTEGLKAIEASIVRTATDGKYPSDHYPVTAVLQLVP